MSKFHSISANKRSKRGGKSCDTSKGGQISGVSIIQASGAGAASPGYSDTMALLSVDKAFCSAGVTVST